MRDYFTATVDGAAAFERMYGEPACDDRPTRHEAERDTDRCAARGCLSPAIDRFCAVHGGDL